MFHRVTMSLLVSLSATTSPVHGQIPTGARLSTTRVNTAPKLLVANPTANTADSLAAVTIGTAMRDRLERGIGSSYAVLSRQTMNDALLQFGYPADAILPVSAARVLAAQLAAPATVTSTLSKSPDGHYMLTARVAATNDLYAGFVVNATQAPGQSLADFGNRTAEALAPAVKAMPDAKACIDQQSSNKSKAAESANKALKTVPNHGLAELCLAMLAVERGDTTTQLRHLENAAKGDPQSLVVLSAIGTIGQIRGDTTRVIDVYQRMLAVAPTNQELREAAYRLFNQYNRPEAAMQVVDKGLEVDPANPDLYDLRSNICLGKEDYDCAIKSLEQVYALDSAKADTTFYIKMLGSAQSKPDTIKLLEWSRRGALKYPENTVILEGLARAFGLAGMPDSAVVVTRRLIQADPSNTGALLQVVNTLANSTTPRQALEFTAAVRASDEDTKNTFASVLLNTAGKFVNEPNKDYPLVLALSDSALAVGPTSQQLIDAGNYFVSVVLFEQVTALSRSTRQPPKNCENAREYQRVLTRVEATSAIAARSATASMANYAKQLVKPVQDELKVIGNIVSSNCG